MRLFHKIALLLIAAMAVPLATVGFAVVAANQRALEQEVRARFDQTARHAADAVAADIEGRARQLAQTAGLISWDRLDAGEAQGALEIIRRQARALVAGLYGPDGASARAVIGSLGGPATLDAQAVLAAQAPLERARREGAGAVVFSPPFALPAPASSSTVAASGRPAAPMALGGAMAVRGGVIALALPLAGCAQRLDEVRGDQAAALTLLDDRGKILARSAPPGAPPPSPAALADALDGKDGHARRYLDGPRATVAAFAQVGGLGWSLLVDEDAARAFAVPRRMQRITVAVTCLAALAGLIVAFAFAGRLTRALERLAEAARAFGRGQLYVRLPPGARDEVGALAATFNQMGDELAVSRAEIERWNRELEARVEERTRQLKEAQAQLVQAQKLAALGQLGAGVAHEINNPLGGVLGHVQLLLADRSPDHPDYEDLRCIDEAARRASQVVQNLQRFSVQHKEAVRTHVELNKLLRDTLSLTESLLSERRITLDWQLADPPPRARADAGQLGQVLLNLVANARTAMPEGGRLTLRTGHVAGSADKPGEVTLTVEDTGKGIANESLGRIFEPFFTTKDEWSNVGLGLSVSYRIVEEHGGRIDVQSELGRGSTFTVYLPQA